MADLKSDRPNQLTQPKTSCIFNQNMTADDKLECQQQKGTFGFLLWHSLTLYHLDSSLGSSLIIFSSFLVFLFLVKNVNINGNRNQ